jgi:anti-sigma B factor antagonist
MAVFDLTTERADDRVTVALTGELDISTGPQLDEELRRVEGDAPRAVIVVDLRGLEFIDSSGLRVLIAADARAHQRGARLVIVRGPEIVRRVFEVTRLDERLNVVEEPPASAAS